MIATAYDAYWFLHDHPHFWKEEYNRCEPGTEQSRSYDIVIDGTGQHWKRWKLNKHSIDVNLSIFYYKKKSGKAECWLEFGGPLKTSGGYEYGFEEGEAPMYLFNAHDYKLDVAAPSFDEALIRLANRAMKLYGPLPTAVYGEMDDPEDECR